MLDVFPEDEVWIDEQMRKRGFDPNDNTTDLSKPQGVGNVAARRCHRIPPHDGANQLGDELGSNGKPYSDYTFYRPVNSLIKSLTRIAGSRLHFNSATAKPRRPVI
jgi:hypothetical protein